MNLIMNSIITKNKYLGSTSSRGNAATANFVDSQRKFDGLRP